MDGGYNTPWIGGSICHGKGVNIPWVEGRYTMDSRFDIPWVGVKIPLVRRSTYYG